MQAKSTCMLAWRVARGALGGNHDGEGGCQLSRESTGGGQLGQLHAHGTGDIVAVGSKADHKTAGTDQDDPDGRGDGLGQLALLVDVPDGRQGAGHVANLSGTVRKNHTDSREHLHGGNPPSATAVFPPGDVPLASRSSQEKYGKQRKHQPHACMQECSVFWSNEDAGAGQQTLE